MTAALFIELVVLWIGLVVMAVALCMAAKRGDAAAARAVRALRDRSARVLRMRGVSRSRSRSRMRGR